MKKIKLGTLLTIFAMALFIFSCGDSGHSHDENGEHAEETTTQSDENTEADKTGKEYTSAHICPMHCKGSGGDEPGKCPACGMDYVVNENYKSNSEAAEDSDSDGVEHDHDGDGHADH